MNNIDDKRKGIRDNINKLFHDADDKEFHLKYFFAILAAFLSAIIAGQITFPGGYSIAKYYISRMGNLDANPHGWFFYDVGAALFSVLIVPHFIYLYRRFNRPPVAKTLVYLFIFSSLVGAFGLFLVGIIPNSILNLESVHNLGSTLAFGGFGLAALCSLIINLIRVIKKERYPDPYFFFIGYALVFLVGINIIVNQGSLQQWSGFFTVMTWMIMLSLMM